MSIKKMHSEYLFDDKVGDRIKAIRKSTFPSQKAFADYFGINQGHLSKIERGVIKPSPVIIRSICFAFGKNAEWLASGQGIEHSASITDDEMYQIMDNAEDLSRDQILSLLEKTEHILRKVISNIGTVHLSRFILNKNDIDLMTAKKRIENAATYLKDSIGELAVK
ncbi:MAG: helix-turn-helix transcriptional regulator [Desulfobacterales bacterium]|jgi:transcriptional regulator with XRE-family HTH domain|nr:helix-turn-helix transcriptional regulator [Desulfobacterales bacterium]